MPGEEAGEGKVFAGKSPPDVVDLEVGWFGPSVEQLLAQQDADGDTCDEDDAA